VHKAGLERIYILLTFHLANRRNAHMSKKDLRQMKNEKSGKAPVSKKDIYEIAKKANLRPDLDKVDNKDIQNMQQVISKYENKSENELMGELERMIQNGRKDGSFSNEMLDAFVKNVAPMMDSSQRKKLDSIAKMIKNKQ
jgi:hypothetical protein